MKNMKRSDSLREAARNADDSKPVSEKPATLAKLRKDSIEGRPSVDASAFSKMMQARRQSIDEHSATCEPIDPVMTGVVGAAESVAEKASNPLDPPTASKDFEPDTNRHPSISESPPEHHSPDLEAAAADLQTAQKTSNPLVNAADFLITNDNPDNDNGGGSSSELKLLFDDAGNPIKAADHPDRYPGHLSMAMVYLWASFSVTTFSYVIPVSVEYTSYLGHDQFMAGLVVAVACFLSGFAGYPSYMFTNKYGLRWSFIACTILFIVGLFMYILACPTQSFALLIVARCVLGVGAQLIPYWYTASAVGVNKRTMVNQLVNASIASGYSIGPFISAFMYAATKNIWADGGTCKEKFDDENCVFGVEDYGNDWWNRVTSASWIIIIMLFGQLAVFVFKFPEPPKESESSATNADGTQESPMQGIMNMEWKEKVAFGTNLFASFCLPIVIASWEIVSVNEAVFTWKWHIEYAAVYVGLVFLFLIPVTAGLAWYLTNKVKMEDRLGQVVFGATSVLGFFFLWDYFQTDGSAGAVVCYTIGSFILLTGFQLARGFCWTLISKQVPTHSKGLGNFLLFFWYIMGRGAGSLIADTFRTDAQSSHGYDDFEAWSPRNTYAWSMQLLCILVTCMWAGLYTFMVPAKGSS